MCLSLPFQWILYFISIYYWWVVDGGEFDVWDFSDDLHPLFNSMELHTFKTTKEEKNTPLINPIHPFTLLLKHPHILKHIPLICLMINFYQYLCQVLILNLYRSNCSDSIFLLQFFYKSWKYFSFLLAQALPNINTKPNIWLLTKYTNEVTYN